VASANSEVPIHAPPTPAGNYSARETSGSTKIITTAQTMTVVMAIGACSFSAPTAPAMAIAAETPHTAPPAPKVAARRRSSPRRRLTN